MKSSGVVALAVALLLAAACTSSSSNDEPAVAEPARPDASIAESKTEALADADVSADTAVDAAMDAAADAGPGIVFQDGFESVGTSDTCGWDEVRGSATSHALSANSGAASCELCPADKGPGGITRRLAATPGTYTLTVFGRTTEPSGSGSLSLGLSFLDASEASTGAAGQAGSVTDAWAPMAISSVGAAAGTVAVVVSISPGGCVLVDDVVLHRDD